jgi:hypothetical protein
MDTSGNILDGEYSGTFPSGNGVPGGDFVAQFMVNAPPPPLPPTLVAQGANRQVSLGWTASAGATSYNVKRGIATGTEVNIVTGVTATGFTDSGLTNGTTYFYVVTAVGAGGESPSSNEVLVIPDTGTAGVTNLTAGGCGATGTEALLLLVALSCLRKARLRTFLGKPTV